MGTERPAESKDCFFCEDAQKPQNIIYENSFFYAQFDKFPVSPGHAEIISKKHIVSLLDLNPEEIISLHEAIKETTHLIDSLDLREIYTKLAEKPINEKSAWFLEEMLKHPRIDKKPDGYNYGNNDGAAAGRTIHHLHIHIIPRYTGDVPDPTGGIRNLIPGKGKYK